MLYYDIMAKITKMSQVQSEALSLAEVLTPEFLAALKGVDVEVKYRDAKGKDTTRVLMNCTFQMTLEGNLVCVGYDPNEQQVRSLRVDRMQSLQAISKNPEDQEGRAA